MSNITIEKLKDSKAKLEADLLNSISNLISDFEKDNRVTVDYVSIDMTSVQQINEPKARSIITGVDVGIDLY